MAHEVAIIDVGSANITAIIGARGINGTISVKGMGECEYAGYEDGEWYRPDELINAVERALSLAQTEARTKINHLYIGVPGHFTVSQCKEVSMSLGKKRKVYDEDVEELVDLGDTFKDDPNYELINCQPIFYTLDDERKLIQPVGLTSNRLSGFLSYILAEKKFTEKFDHIMDELEIESYDYVSSILAESLFLFDDYTRDGFVVCLDVGYIVSDLFVVRGDGILRQFNIPFGGGHITKALRDDLNIRFALAEKLKRKIILNLEFSDNDTYDVSYKDKVTSFSARQVNDIVASKLSKLSRTITNCLASCDLPASTSFYLTGGGLSYMSGARDFLSKKLNKHVEIAKPELPQYNKPHLSSAFGLMDMVLGNEEPAKKKGWFARLFGR